MGIPHLITYLQPFAQREALTNQQIVIDGPGFAHHVYYICMGSRDGARNAFEAAPSYAVLVNTAVAWLDALRESNVKIRKIYFDGFLPDSKSKTRHERLSRSTTRLSHYHSTHPVPCRSSFKPLTHGPISLFGNSAIRSCLGTLPPSPFLVPAVLEALLKADAYKEAVEVVPGEADLYLGNFVHEHGGVIITGDSDLLVHDLGNDGAVCFLKDIQLEEYNQLASLLYRPAVIAERLALPTSHGLHPLAFEMLMDPHGTFPKLIAQAKLMHSIKTYPEMFVEFIKEYKQLPETIAKDDRKVPDVLSVLQKLDPRISEYVLQFHSLARIAGQTPLDQTSKDLHVFLPFILDCPVRTNAWDISTATRQFAYGLLNLIVPEVERKSTVFEHRRQQDKSKGLELQLPSISDISEACKTLLTLLLQIKEKWPELSEVELWICIAVYQEMEIAHLYAKPPLSEAVVKGHQRSKSEFAETLTWEVIHLLGQIEGSYYSFRFLKQITNLVLIDSGESVPEVVSTLAKQLETVPDLSELPSHGGALSLLVRVDTLGVLRYFREVLGTSSETSVRNKTMSKKGKRKRDQSSSAHLVDRKKSSNPFDLLEVE